MSTFLPIFDVLTAKYPAERHALEELAKLLIEKRRGEYTLDHLVAKLTPESVESLAAILAELTQAGLVRRIIRIESPTRGGGIRDFDTLYDVPSRIHDWRADEEITVTPERLRVLFSAK